MRKKYLRILIIAGVLPLLVYPVFTGLSLLSDGFIGDKTLITRLVDGSFGRLLSDGARDWKASLPVAYAGMVLGLLPAHWLLERMGSMGVVALAAFVGIGGAVLSYAVMGADLWSAAVFSASGVALAALFAGWWRLMFSGKRDALP